MLWLHLQYNDSATIFQYFNITGAKKAQPIIALFQSTRPKAQTRYRCSNLRGYCRLTPYLTEHKKPV